MAHGMVQQDCAGTGIQCGAPSLVRHAGRAAISWHSHGQDEECRIQGSQGCRRHVWIPATGIVLGCVFPPLLPWAVPCLTCSRHSLSCSTCFILSQELGDARLRASPHRRFSPAGTAPAGAVGAHPGPAGTGHLGGPARHRGSAEPPHPRGSSVLGDIPQDNGGTHPWQQKAGGPSCTHPVPSLTTACSLPARCSSNSTHFFSRDSAIHCSTPRDDAQHCGFSLAPCSLLRHRVGRSGMQRCPPKPALC